MEISKTDTPLVWQDPDLYRGGRLLSSWIHISTPKHFFEIR